MPTATVENYLKAIYRLSGDQQASRAATGQIARQLGVAPGTVSGMLSRLTSDGLVDYAPRQGAQLTRRGRRRAVQIVRRHRLLELFLVKTLGMAWDEVHVEAERLEHSVSDDLVNRIDAFLGYPERDPHGDPIPDPKGIMRTGNGREGRDLSSCSPGESVELLQVADDSADLLRYLSDRGLQPGVHVKVVCNDKSAGVVELQSARRRVSLSRDVARQLRVRSR